MDALALVQTIIPIVALFSGLYAVWSTHKKNQGDVNRDTRSVAIEESEEARAALLESFRHLREEADNARKQADEDRHRADADRKKIGEQQDQIRDQEIKIWEQQNRISIHERKIAEHEAKIAEHERRIAADEKIKADLRSETLRLLSELQTAQRGA